MRKRFVRKTKENRIYFFSGLMVCGECGRRMSGKLNAKSANPCYNCPSHYGKFSGCSNKVNINEKKLALELMDMIEIKMEELRVQTEKAELARKGRDYRVEISAQKRKLSRLKELFLAELIDIDEYRTDYETLTQKIKDLEEKEKPVKRPNLSALEALLHDGWRSDYESVDREAKKRFWRILIREIRIYPDRHIEFDLNV